MSDYSFSEYEIERAFYDFVAAQGYEPDYKNWKPDGVRRTARLKSSADKGHESSAKARLYVDKPAKGWIYDYRHDVYLRWNYLDAIGGDRKKHGAYRAQLPSAEEQAAKQAAREQYEAWERDEAIRKAREKFDLAKPFNGTHEYLTRKGVQAHEGLRRDTYGNLVIPMYKLPNTAQIVNYQRIAPDGGKYFAPDCGVAGAVYIIGRPRPDMPLGLAEGYATAASVYETTGIPIAVCFNCHNLKTAAKDIKEHIKAKDYFIFADNDRANAERPDLQRNHGMEAARKAIRELGKDEAHVIAPPAESGCNVDWNDRAGELKDAPEVLVEELRAKISYAEHDSAGREAINLLDSIKPITADRLREIKEQRGRGLDIGWIMYNARNEAIPLKFQGLVLLAARTSGGKTLSLANIAARAIKKDPDAHVLFISLEESEESVYYRILSSYIAQTAGIASPTKREIERSIDIGEKWRTYSNDNRDKWNAITVSMNYLEEHILIADLITVPDLDNVAKTAELIKAFYERYGEHAVICLDYIQILKPPKQGAGDYRDFKQVVNVLRGVIARKVNIFAGAQLNREPAKEARNDPVREFQEAYCEQLREAADIEQAAEVILYCRIDARDTENPYMNYRVLKNRRGIRDVTMSMRLDFSREAMDWGRQEFATLRDNFSIPIPIPPTEVKPRRL